MNIKNATLLFLLISIPLFSQEVAENKGISIVEKKLSYLDSIKKTFVNDDLASCVDSLWIKELTDLDLYNDITNDIENINVDEKVDYELSTELLQSRLAEMNAKSPFRIEYNPSLENVIKSFLKYRKKSFGRLMAISEYYFPLFEEEFAKNNVPLEMKYLAVVESALNPKAVSKMGATGLWQFMYHTGKQYNLTIDSYVDERSDPLKATAAASQYMTNMHAIFGDWELVLAAYNSGPGNVSKAIRRSGGKQNYWNIRKNLPKETQGYVPAFLATMYLYTYRKEHGIVPDRAEVPHFATDTIMIKREISFKQISDLLDVPVSQLQLLNPSYKLNLVPFYKDKNHYLRLPLDKIAVFTSNEDKIYAYAQYQLEQKESPFQPSIAIASQTVSQTRTKYYKVRRGDNLGAIADKYDVSVTDLKKWNGIKGNTIAAGKSLKIISTENRVKTVKNEPKIEIAATQAKNTKTTKIAKEVSKDSLAATASFYIVQKGDNLNAIAKNNNVTVAQIKEWNHLSGDAIQLGASLRLTAIENDAEEIVVSNTDLKNREYIVQKGDNLGNIAKKFGITLTDLKQWNNLSDNNIVLGHNLIVGKEDLESNTKQLSISTFKKKGNVAVVPKQESSYFVQKGDSLYSIAKKYPGVTVSDIKKWNDISGEEIKPGMKLKIGG
ncbi:LysM peptidoglycan-binding domain-containing protein [Flavobacterium granuli]|uniref:Membrane-bound lytic murein transglycosylase D n=1 Tax=Flavobacterium granuli TaxID=280093 RepID=A0A1M5K9I1_9FLAO|nr:LysM peptidoglycan-binding domain-containing protein [Flavobacterium granuli]PRZ26211.1 membrane-bound lytic murein transglycosylase D [Flavobacterium granuli]SHG49445.1 membrane-bound lytic murein transglycosylase D [Flavobacterium granuli]